MPKTTSIYSKVLAEEANLLLPDSYIYISHLDGEICAVNKTPQFWRLPGYPDSISDTMESKFTPTTALGRTAPVYTYSNSGPRVVQIDLPLHRDIMMDLNIGVSNATLQDKEDYLDSLIRALQAIALPKYNLSNKLVEPPLVAVRLADEIFIKGIVTSSIGLTYKKPILENNRYAQIGLSLTITEVDPYDASSVFKNGGFRGMVNVLKKTSSEQRMGEW